MSLFRTLLALSFLATTFAASAALADAPAHVDAPVEPYPAEPAEAVPNGDVEAIFEGGVQALMFDRDRGEYVVVRVGDTFQGRLITAIAADRVVVSAGAQHFVLSLPRPALKKPAAPASPKPPPPSATPTGPALDQPLDPYHQDSAHSEPAEGAARSASKGPAHQDSAHPEPAEGAARSASKGPAPQYSAHPEPAEGAARSASKGPTPQYSAHPEPAEGEARSASKDEQITISRSELDAALADFTTLSQEIQLTREDQRIRVKHVSPGTFLHRIGLRPGDLLVSVADKAIYDLDAAAQAYSVLKRADRFVIKLYRGDKRMKIHVQLKP